MKKKIQGDGQHSYFSASGYDYSEKLYISEMQSVDREIELAKKRQTEEELQRFRLSAGLSTKLQQPTFVAVKEKKSQSINPPVVIAKRKRIENNRNDIDKKAENESGRKAEPNVSSEISVERTNLKNEVYEGDVEKIDALTFLSAYSDDDEADL